MAGSFLLACLAEIRSIAAAKHRHTTKKIIIPSDSYYFTCLMIRDVRVPLSELKLIFLDHKPSQNLPKPDRALERRDFEINHPSTTYEYYIALNCE